MLRRENVFWADDDPVNRVTTYTPWTIAKGAGLLQEEVPQAAAPVQYAVARQVNQHHIPGAAAGQEHADRPSYLALIGIDDRGNGEAADASVTQDFRRGLRVVSSGAQLT